MLCYTASGQSGFGSGSGDFLSGDFLPMVDNLGDDNTTGMEER